VKPSFVADCSIALAWCFIDEGTPATKELLDRMAGECVLVPGWWFIELTNVLVVAERKGRINPDQTAEFLALIESFDLEIDDESPGRAFLHVLPLCRAHQLTSYDAVYLELALRRHLPLATLDEELRIAATKSGVALLGKSATN